MPPLFPSYSLNDVILRNRIVAAPMCMHMAVSGCLAD